MLVEVERRGWRGGCERVLTVQDPDANAVEDFADLEDVGRDVGAVVLWCDDGIVIVLEDQGCG